MLKLLASTEPSHQIKIGKFETLRKRFRAAAGNVRNCKAFNKKGQ